MFFSLQVFIGIESFLRTFLFLEVVGVLWRVTPKAWTQAGLLQLATGFGAVLHFQARSESSGSLETVFYSHRVITDKVGSFDKICFGKHSSRLLSSFWLPPPPCYSSFSLLHLFTSLFLLPLRHWFHFWHSMWPLNKEWQGQHSQFLRCFYHLPICTIWINTNISESVSKNRAGLSENDFSCKGEE